MCSTTVHRLQHVRKKVRHVGQRQVDTSHFDLVNPYHADFDVENSLCSKSRVLAGGYNKNKSIIQQGLQHQDGSGPLGFRPPSLLLY